MIHFLTRYFYVADLMFFAVFLNNNYFLSKLIDYTIEHDQVIYIETLIMLLNTTIHAKNNQATILLLNTNPNLNNEQLVYDAALRSIENDNIELFKILIPDPKKYNSLIQNYGMLYSSVVEYEAVQILKYIIKLGENNFKQIIISAIERNKYIIFKETIVFFKEDYWCNINSIFVKCLNNQRYDMNYLLIRYFNMKEEYICSFIRELATNNIQEFIVKFPEKFDYILHYSGKSKQLIRKIKHELSLNAEQNLIQ